MEEAMKLIEKLDYESAKNLLENSLKSNENDTELLDLYAEVLINLDLTEEAKKVLKGLNRFLIDLSHYSL